MLIAKKNHMGFRGFSVDVGIIEYNYTDAAGKNKKTQLEVDFVVSEGSRRYYIQVCFNGRGRREEIAGSPSFSQSTRFV